MGDDLITIVNKEGTLRAGINPNTARIQSLTVDGKELVAEPGRFWYVMFPIIGPANLNDTLPQHGLARHARWSPEFKDRDKATFSQRYTHDGQVPFTTSRGAGVASLYFSYLLGLTYVLRGKSLEISANVRDLPANIRPELGLHPSFLAQGGQVETRAAGVSVTKSLTEIQKDSNSDTGAWIPEQVSDATYVREDGARVRVQTNGFSTMMFWSPDGKLICMEPISRRPRPEYQLPERLDSRLASPIEAMQSRPKYQIKVTPTVVA